MSRMMHRCFTMRRTTISVLFMMSCMTQVMETTIWLCTLNAKNLRRRMCVIS